MRILLIIIVCAICYAATKIVFVITAAGWFIIAATCFSLVGFIIGHEYACRVISTECKRLGRFYVGKEVFECTNTSSKFQEK